MSNSSKPTAGASSPAPAGSAVLFDSGPEYQPLAMVERAVRNARPHSTMSAPRWVAVRDVFGYGSTTSVDLCRRFGLDPHETVKGVRCDCEDEDQSPNATGSATTGGKP